MGAPRLPPIPGETKKKRRKKMVMTKKEIKGFIIYVEDSTKEWPYQVAWWLTDNKDIVSETAGNTHNHGNVEQIKQYNKELYNTLLLAYIN
mgnify:CR=1 FL=1